MSKGCGRDIIIIDDLPFIYNLLQFTKPDIKKIHIFLLCLKHSPLPYLPLELVLEITKHITCYVYECFKCNCFVQCEKAIYIDVTTVVCYKCTKLQKTMDLIGFRELLKFLYSAPAIYPDVKRRYLFLLVLQKSELPQLPAELIVMIAKQITYVYYQCSRCPVLMKTNVAFCNNCE